MNERSAQLAELLADYRKRYPKESETVDRFLEFALSGEVLQGKANLARHVTASAWIVSGDGGFVLLTHHKKLNKWVQLGGHTDEGEDWLAAALREAHEESGLERIERTSEAIYDLDVHTIPARPDQGEHDHYDVRFLFEADRHAPIVVSEESVDVRWVPVEDLGRYTQEESQQRMARKLTSARNDRAIDPERSRRESAV